MAYLEFDRWLPLKIIILLEGLWVFYFAALVFVFQLGTYADSIRLSLILLAFHAAAPIGLITSMEHKHDHGIPMAPFVWILMAVFTDFWSVFDIYLHLEEGPLIVASALSTIKGLATIAIILSLAGALWYLILLIWGRVEAGKAKSVLKSFDMEDSEGGTEMKTYDRFGAAINLRAKATTNIRQSILK